MATDQPARPPRPPGELPVVDVLLELPAPVLLVDEAGTIVLANRDAGELFHRIGDDLLDRSLGELLSTPQSSPLALDRLDDGDPHPVFGRGVEALGYRPDGAHFSAFVSARRVAGPRGPLVALVLRDLSAFQREAAARRSYDERVHRLLETARVIPWEADVATTEFTFVGPQAEEILGYPVDAWYEEGFWPRHIHPDDRDEALTTCAAALTRQTHYAFEYRMIAADGRVVWIHDIVVVARWRGEPHLLSGFMLDVTAQKQADAERARLLAEAQRAIRVRDEFTHIAAHELRTPLTPLRLHLEQALRLVARAPTSGDHPRHLAVALRQLERLEGLVETLLDVARIRQGRLTLELAPCDLGELVREVAASLAGLLERAGCPLTLRAAPGVVGRWDRVRLEQALTNLLTNAAKYGASAPIEVSVTADRERARLVVRDHGIGIDPADHERIFEWCERAAPTASYGGLGLGLYITRQVIAAHGGTIRVDSDPGAGSTLTVELPLDPDARPTDR